MMLEGQLDVHTFITLQMSHSPSHLSSKRVFFILGGPGAGKGTQCTRLQTNFPDRYVHLSAGDLLREASAKGGELGDSINECIRHGKIVPMQVFFFCLSVCRDKCISTFVLVACARVRLQSSCCGVVWNL